MCEANVFLRDSEEDEYKLFMESVDKVTPAPDNELIMENIFGHKQIIKGKINRMELVDHKILVERV